MLVLEAVLASKVRVEAVLVVDEAQVERAVDDLVAVGKVNGDGERALRVVHRLAAQEPGGAAGQVDEAIELVVVRCERELVVALEVGHEQPIDLDHVLGIGDVALAAHHHTIGEVVVGRVDRRHPVLGVVRRVSGRVAVAGRGEVAHEPVEDEVRGRVAQIVSHLEVEVESLCLGLSSRVGVVAERSLDTLQVGVDGRRRRRWAAGALRLDVEQGVERALVPHAGQVERAEEGVGVRVARQLGHRARYDELVGAVDGHVLVRVEVVHVALVVDERLERYGDVRMDEREGAQVVVAGVELLARVVQVVGQELHVVEADEAGVAGEEALVARRVRKRVVADEEALVAELLVQLDPPHELHVVLGGVRGAVEVAVGAGDRAALGSALATLGAAHLELDGVAGAQAASHVLDEQAEFEFDT